MLHVMPGKARTQDNSITGWYWAVMIWTTILILFVSAVDYFCSIRDVVFEVDDRAGSLVSE